MALASIVDAPDAEVIHAQFNRLLGELLKGAFNRNSFQPWEIELILDIQACDFGDSTQKELLKRYQKAVQRAYDKGAKMPMKLSEYLANLRSRRLPPNSKESLSSRPIAS